MQFYYLINYDLRLANYREKVFTPGLVKPVSVIVCAKNEEQNLKQYLHWLLEQYYPQYEVVVVNDGSIDDTGFVLKDYASAYPHLKIVDISGVNYSRGKKFAVTMGIKAAQYDHLLFTDADCIPESREWITRMQSHFAEGKEIVLGYSPYERHSGPLNAFIRFETVKTAISYLSSAIAGDAYMGIGRNMGYTKSLFFEGGGFATHMHIPSGDDDLFVNENATAENTAIEIQPDAHVYSEPKSTWSSFYRQKTRHSRAGILYKPRHRRRLTMQAMSGSLFYASLILLLLMDIEPVLVCSLYALRMIIIILVHFQAFKKLRAADLVIWIPLLDMVYYIYLNIFGFIGFFSSSKRWK